MADDNYMWSNPDRDRGVLTPDDRKFLLGQTDYKNPQSARRRRARIRQRVTDALLDFHLLCELEDRDRDQIFDRESADLGIGFSGAYSFLYDGLVRYWDDYEHVDMNLIVYIEQAIQKADFNRGYRTEFTMDLERDKLADPRQIFQRAKEQGYQSLTWPELEYIWESTEVNADEFARFLSNMLGEDIDARQIRLERNLTGK